MKIFEKNVVILPLKFIHFEGRTKKSSKIPWTHYLVQIVLSLILIILMPPSNQDKHEHNNGVPQI